jgi:hypothetical protein
MRSMKQRTSLRTLVILLLVVGVEMAGAAPQLAAASQRIVSPISLDGIIDRDNDDTLAFTPDGNTAFFDRSEGLHKTIMVSHRVDGVWMHPQPASFSGKWFDQNPVISPDGSYLLFNSDRPVTPDSRPLVQSYFPSGPGPGSNIWRTNRQGDYWSDPVWLGPTINDDVFIDFASVAADDTLYYMRLNHQAKAMQVWRSHYRGGKYLAAEYVVLGDVGDAIHDPAVAPDQSYIVFNYGKTKGGLGRLCIAFREGDHWGNRIDLGEAVNSGLPWGSHLGTDGQTLYFTDRSGIEKISLLPWLRAHQSNVASPSQSRR